MKYSLLLPFLSLFIISNAQRSIPSDSIYMLIKERSIHRDKADWPKIETAFKEKLRSSKNQIDTVKAIVFIFEVLGDYHSQVNFNGRQYANYPDFDEETLKNLVPLVTRSNEETGQIKSQMFRGNIGYIQIPGLMARNELINVYAQTISDSICNLASKKAVGYIIDLRLNGGGQLASMLAGLNMLLGEGYIGGGVDINGKESQRFEIKGSNFSLNSNPMTQIKNNCKGKLSKKPVVVLIGPVTRSSGSITAIAFKGRPSTYFIGEPTADGYTTGNDFYSFGPNLDVNLSVANSIDRNKKVYPHLVEPDLIVKGGDNFMELEDDAKVKAAVKWIKGNY